MSRGNKSQIIVYQQTREIYLFMINASKQRKDIIQYFVEKWTEDGVFDKSVTMISKHRTIDNYIKKVRDTFFNFEKEVNTEKGRSLARLDDLYTKSIKIQDYKAALVILKEINELTGVKKEVITNLNYNVEVSKEEAKNINEALEDKY